VLGLKRVGVLRFEQKDAPTVVDAVKGRTGAGVAFSPQLVSPFVAGGPGLFNLFPIGFEKYFLNQTHYDSSILWT
jgi:hypothetical protein